MERNWTGLDFLRGLGIFGLLIMHTAFYYYSDLWTIDLENPPLIITIIGFLLMFAGLFAMISGAVHAIGIHRLASQRQWPVGRIVRKKLVSAAVVLTVAYLYFIFTGPGLADFSQQRMNNSLLVEWIRYGRWAGWNLDRILYIDSLVMIGTNIILLTLILAALLPGRHLKPGRIFSLACLAMAVSLLRIPLFPIYQEQLAAGNWPVVLLLNGLVNKNNPILPYLAFALFGAWLGLVLEHGRSRRPAALTGAVLLAGGLAAYVFLPDTMLQRAIDGKWYSIMATQLGLFILMILGATAWLDRQAAWLDRQAEGGGQPAGNRLPGAVVRFVIRFGTAGLTAFFWESAVAALAWRLLTALWPGLRLGIGPSLLFGLVLALGWGLLLTAWRRWHYAGSIEWLYGLVVARLGGGSSKTARLRSGHAAREPAGRTGKAA